MKIPIQPMLAKITDNKPFTSKYYSWEDKIDGLRAIIVTGKDYHIFARSGEEKTDQFPEVRVSTRSPCVLDGEIAIRGRIKKWDFQSIQRRMNRDKEQEKYAELLPAEFFAFDIVSVNGKPLVNSPLYFRRQKLWEQILLEENIHIVQGLPDSEELLKIIASQRGEGIIGKDLYEPYKENSRRWLKVKFGEEKWFNVCAYTEGLGKRKDKFGTLILCEFNNRLQKIVGEVGTGFTDAEMYDLLSYMNKHPAHPTSIVPVNEPAHYINPDVLKVKVRYLELTNDGMLRCPSVLEYQKE